MYDALEATRISVATRPQGLVLIVASAGFTPLTRELASHRLTAEAPPEVAGETERDTRLYHSY